MYICIVCYPCGVTINDDDDDDCTAERLHETRRTEKQTALGDKTKVQMMRLRFVILMTDRRRVKRCIIIIMMRIIELCALLKETEH